MINLSREPRGEPIPSWKLSRNFVKWYTNLPSPQALHQIVTTLSIHDDRYTTETLPGGICSSSFNDGSGNGFDILTSPRGALFLGLDHEIHEGLVYKDSMLRIIPIDMKPLASLGKFSCIDDGCPVGVIMWRRDPGDYWHVGLTQKNVDVFKSLL